MAEHARVPGYAATADELAAFLAAGLSFDPPLVLFGQERFALSAQQELWDLACDLAYAHWRDPAVRAAVGEAAVTEGLGRWAAYEVLAATAAGCAHAEHGQLDIDEAEGAQASGRVLTFVEEAGFAALVRAFCTGAAFEDLQAVAFYNPMAEQDFLAKAAHRPWAAGPLDDDLVMAVAAGTLQIRLAGDRRQLWLTPHGRAVLAELRERLLSSGLLGERQRVLAVAHRNLCAGRHPAALAQQWDQLLAAAGLHAGQDVLVCGLALGGRAFVEQVAATVAPGGVTVVDPAARVLRALHREPGGLPDGVRLIPGRFDALPLSDAAVDVALAPDFLHLVDHERVLAEVRRVVRPGGRVALAVPHTVDLGHALLREWLAPVLELAEQLGVPASGALGVPGHAAAALRQVGFVATTIAPHDFSWQAEHAGGALLNILHGSAMGRGVLERAPWRERRALLQGLLERAEGLVAAAGAGALVSRGELVVASVP